MNGYMVFFRETDFQHYLYNGTRVIAINPDQETLVHWHHNHGIPDHKSKLDQALDSKARGFIASARFQIILRANYYSE